jgi:hypothetical protein
VSEARSGDAAWLRLAASPTFAVMALATAMGGPAEVVCSAAHASPLSGMVAMYALMSAFHCGPWLRLFASRGRSADPR